MFFSKIIPGIVRTTCERSIRNAATKVAVIGAPINKGQPKEGVQNGPQVLRQTGIIEKLQSHGLQVSDAGDLTPSWQTATDVGPDGEKNFLDVMNYNRMLSEKIADLKRNHDLCLTLGGDHSIGIGTVIGHQQGTPDKQVLVLWVDAHADINTGKTSWSSNMHGMSTSYLLKDLDSQLNKLSEQRWPKPILDNHHIAYIGLRDLDVEEKRLLDHLKIKYSTMRDVDALGIKEVIARSFDHLDVKSTNSLHVSFDIDSLDPVHASSTGTPVPGGLHLREGIQIVEAAFDTGRLGGFDLVEVNPSLGSQNDLEITKRSAHSILLAAIAGARGT